VPLEDFADDIIVVATDIVNVALLLEQLDDPRAELVRKIPLVDLVSVNCFFKTQPIEGFGLLFPLSENKSARGVLFNASIFPDKTASDAQSSETWIFGAPAPYCESVKNDDFFIQEICQLRQEIWGHQERPLSWRVNRWERALPLYGLTLERVLADLAIERNNVFLMGNYLGDIGLNRILLRAQALADRISQVGHAADS
jgi:oxygen-dependent protoporphyrinogen oxidase